jgi:hypothetical protein
VVILASTPPLGMMTFSGGEQSCALWITRRNIPEDTILHSHRREILKPYAILEMLCPIIKEVE